MKILSLLTLGLVLHTGLLQAQDEEKKKVEALKRRKPVTVTIE